MDKVILKVIKDSTAPQKFNRPWLSPLFEKIKIEIFL